jgi:hypothetical protein
MLASLLFKYTFRKGINDILFFISFQHTLQETKHPCEQMFVREKKINSEILFMNSCFYLKPSYCCIRKINIQR